MSKALRLLIQNNLNQNFNDIDDPKAECFYFEDKKYFLNSDYIEDIKSIILGKIPKLKNRNFNIAGGSVLDAFLVGHGFFTNDVDLFPHTLEDYEALKLELNEKMNGSGTIRENENACLFKHDEFTIDLIKKPEPSLEKLISGFDINVCAIGFNEKEFKYLFDLQDVFSLNASFTNLDKELPAVDYYHIFNRYVKYSKKGFTFNKDHKHILYAKINSGKIAEKESEIKVILQREDLKRYKKPTQVISVVAGTLKNPIEELFKEF